MKGSQIEGPPPQQCREVAEWSFAAETARLTLSGSSGKGFEETTQARPRSETVHAESAGQSPPGHLALGTRMADPWIEHLVSVPCVDGGPGEAVPEAHRAGISVQPLRLASISLASVQRCGKRGARRPAAMRLR